MEEFDKLGDKDLYLSSIIQDTCVAFQQKTVDELLGWMNAFQNSHFKLEQEACPKTEQEKVVTLIQHLEAACPS